MKSTQRSLARTGSTLIVVSAMATLIVAASRSTPLAADGPVVSITGGQVRGALLPPGGAVFKGIPYARPPVAALRLGAARAQGRTLVDCCPEASRTDRQVARL
jgi:hypothetical protein